MNSGVNKVVRPFMAVWRVLAFTLIICATGSAWARTTLLNYMNFDTMGASGGLTFQKDGGTIDPVQIDGYYHNYSDTSKFGAYSYKGGNDSNAGTVGLQNNTDGLVAVDEGFTISFWFNPNGHDNWNSFFGFGLLNGDNYYFVKRSDNSFNIYKDTTSENASSVGEPVLDGVSYTGSAWNHIAIVCQPGGTSARLYVNGTAYNFSLGEISTTSLREVLLRNGRWHAGSDSAFYRNKQNTLFDDFALFEGALNWPAISMIAAGTSTISDLVVRGLDVSLEEFGGFVTTEPQLAFKNVSLSELTAETLKGRFGGAYISNSNKGKEAKFFTIAEPNDSTLTFEAQMDGDLNGGTEILKSVFLTFTQSGDDVYVAANSVAKWMAKEDNPLGTSLANQGTKASLATSASADGYGIYNLRLPRTQESDATVVWNAGELLMPKIGTDGNKYAITLPASGMSVDDSGNLKVASSGATTGATIDIPGTSSQRVSVLIKYSSLSAFDGVGTLASIKESNNYVVGAKNTANNGLGLTGYFDASSANAYALSTNPSLKTGSGYLQFSYCDDVSGNGGTYAYTGTSPLGLAGGGSTSLRWTNASYYIKQVSVGGPISASSGVVAWPNVAIEQIALFIGKYTANEIAGFDFPSATDTATIAANKTFAEIFPSASEQGDYVINASESVELEISAATTVNTVTFNVDEGKTLTITGSAALTAAGGFCITGKGKVSVSSATSLGGKFKGDGKIAYIGVAPPTGKGWQNSNAWKGTVEIDNVGTSGTGWQFDQFGNSSSILKISRLQGHLNYSDGTVSPTVELEDISETPALEVNNGSGGYKTTFNKLAGSGTLKISNGSQNGNGLLIKDVEDFAGSINIVYNNRYTVTVGGDTCTSGANGKLIITSGTTATVADGKLWDARGGIELSGTLVISGAGKVNSRYGTSLVAKAGSTIDVKGFSGTAPAIGGALTIEDGAILKFPENVVFPYKLASSVSSAPDGDITFWVGDKEYAMPLSFIAGAVSPAGEINARFLGTCEWTELTRDLNYVDSMYQKVVVEADGTLTLPSSTPFKVTFDVPSGRTLTLSGTLTALSEIHFTGGGTVICPTADTLRGKITGSCTIRYSSGILPIAEYRGTELWTDTEWTGTNVFTNCGHLRTGGDRVRVPFEKYGNANSFIKAPGFKGFAAVAEGDDVDICNATLIIDSGDVFEFNHGFDGGDIYTVDQNARFRFKKLSGSGKLVLDGTTDYAQYIFCDVSEFTGDVEITFPGSGGRKSYLFGADEDWQVLGSAYPANLAIMGSVTNNNSTWTIPAGVIVNSGDELVLRDGATITALSPNSRGTISVPSGTANILGVTNSVINSALDIAAGATLCISNIEMTSLTIPADTVGGTYSNAGTLDLSECTALTELHLQLGDSKTFDFGKVSLPASCTTVYYYVGAERDAGGYSKTGTFTGTINYIATETIGEFRDGNFTMNNVPSGARVWVIRKTGAIIEAIAPSEGSNQRSYSKGSVFSGGACVREWDFEIESNRLKDTGKDIDTDNAVALTAEAGATYSTFKLANNEDKWGINISSSVHPSYSTGTAFSDNWSAAVRCTMPNVTDGKAVAISFGDTDNGILGLASSANGTVEMFKWNSGTYTPLASLQVESATDKMHIYVVAVTNDTTASKRYVSFYRDGEFIHKVEFASPTTITNVVVGGVAVGATARLNLPADASSGCVDYVRLYDKTLDAVIAAGLSERRPFISLYETYVRTVNGNEVWSDTETRSWASKTNDTVRAYTPEDNTHVMLLAQSQSSMTINLASDATYNTLIFARADDAAVEAPITIGSDGEGKIGAGMIVVRTPVTVNYGAIKFPEAMVGVDAGASLTFNFVDFPYEEVTGTTNVYVTGVVVAREYDTSVDSRIHATGGRSPTWTLSDPTYEPATGRYYVTITLDHAPGSDVYYTGGYWSSNQNTFSVTNASGAATSVFVGDTVVIPAYITGDNATTAYFDSDLPENVTKIRVEKNYTFESGVDNASILGGVAVNVVGGAILSFGESYHAMKLGNVTFNGPGSIDFGVNAEATSIAGNASITVEANKTLTLGSINSFVTGGVSGNGIIKLPAIAEGSINLNSYGSDTGVLALSGSTAVSIAVAEVTQPLKLDGDVELTLIGGVANSFAKVTGTGDLALKVDETAPASITIAIIEEYSGSLNNNSGTAITVSRVALPDDVVGGTKILAKSGDVTVTSVYTNGFVASMPLAYTADGVYKAVAQYGGDNFATFQDAINAATDARLADITVLYASAAMPTGYYYDAGTDHVVKYPAALYVDGVPAYYKSAQSAVDQANAKTWMNADYQYVAIYETASVRTMFTLKIKPIGDIEVTVTNPNLTVESTMGANEPEDGVITYSITPNSTVYTWDSGTSSGIWDGTIATPWRYSDAGTPTMASRAPASVDNIVFASTATIAVRETMSFASITNSAAITLTKHLDEVTLSAAGGIVLTSRTASITVEDGVTIDTPTTTVPGAKVIAVDNGNDTTTYKVVYGTIFSVW